MSCAGHLLIWPLERSLFYCTSFSLKLLLLDLVLFPPRLALCLDQSKRNNFCGREAQVTGYARKVSFRYTELDFL